GGSSTSDSAVIAFTPGSGTIDQTYVSNTLKINNATTAFVNASIVVNYAAAALSLGLGVAMQIEKATSASSYLPTSGSTVSRVADTLTLPLATQALYSMDVTRVLGLQTIGVSGNVVPNDGSPIKTIAVRPL